MIPFASVVWRRNNFFIFETPSARSSDFSRRKSSLTYFEAAMGGSANAFHTILSILALSYHSILKTLRLKDIFYEIIRVKKILREVFFM